MRRKKVRAEITVEAALVLSIILLCYAKLLKAGFERYSMTMEAARLNEAVELKGHIPENDSGLFSDYGQDRFDQIVSHELKHGSVDEYHNGYQGSDICNDHVIQITDKGFHPEKMMRELTILEILDNDAESGKN